jgi:hypothetical protein
MAGIASSSTSKLRKVAMKSPVPLCIFGQQVKKLHFPSGFRRACRVSGVWSVQERERGAGREAAKAAHRGSKVSRGGNASLAKGVGGGGECVRLTLTLSPVPWLSLPTSVFYFSCVHNFAYRLRCPARGRPERGESTRCPAVPAAADRLCAAARAKGRLLRHRPLRHLQRSRAKGGRGAPRLRAGTRGQERCGRRAGRGQTCLHVAGECCERDQYRQSGTCEIGASQGQAPWTCNTRSKRKNEGRLR